MPPSGRPQDSLIRRLFVTLSVVAGTSVVLGAVMNAALGMSPWTAGLVSGTLGLGAYGMVLLRLRKALIRLGHAAEDLSAAVREPEPVLTGFEEVDRMADSLREAGRHFRNTEEALRRERGLLEVVLEALPGGVLLVEADDQVAYSNSACRQMLGAVGDPSGRLALRQIRRLVESARQSDQFYEEILRRGYPERTMDARAFTIDADGRVLVIVVDLTESRRVATMRRDFVTDASHELKTPVAAVLASAEALQMALEQDPASSRMFADRILSAALRLSRLISDLLDLSRLEAQDPAPDDLDLEEVVISEVKQFARCARQKDIAFSVRTTPAAVKGSSAELGLAIRNLCDNALRYTEEGGRITVTLDRQSSEAAVTVTDTGVGIPGRDLGRIFERFYRVDVARSRGTGGTGLGLAIVKHVAERHGGRVTVESLLGEGTTFVLQIPLAGTTPV
ncbi:MAG: two-component sensor histidine kinase [Acidimicrobiia bacterium]|nr:two-component sensor histidine kinase [Acidimicrobiia bacterium]MYA38976.1 two-component sensor histidine kinase [Acidimicrobiia bacterium]MYG92097.1 two-component sensor histidine kinase [Acidimicrobiia bacterium]MYH05668.1 two-component sensor histidine kinase [Acidimicrobiia bacterium]MYJ16150.1 two-component sensor histidine kinase [Acidimicrobiia bacterium]